MQLRDDRERFEEAGAVDIYPGTFTAIAWIPGLETGGGPSRWLDTVRVIPHRFTFVNPRLVSFLPREKVLPSSRLGARRLLPGRLHERVPLTRNLVSGPRSGRNSSVVQPV